MSDMERAEDAALELVKIMRPLTDEQRTTILLLITDEYCENCGREHAKNRRCACWNDE